MESKYIKVVMFDLDGTIVDTEKYYRLNWQKAFAHFGYKISEEQGLNLRSLGHPYVEEYLTSIFGKDIPIDEIKKYARNLVDENVKEYGLELKKGVINCLTFLKKKNVKLVIVTATAVERTKKYISDANIKDFFDDIISAKNVPHGKPAPDVYLTACERIKVKPQETIAIEDSPNGVMSASRAGVNVIMVPDQTEPDEELKKHTYGILKSLDDLERFIDSNNIVFKGL